MKGNCLKGKGINEVLAKNGLPSSLYKNLVQVYNNNYEQAYNVYLKVHTKEFKNWFGDWEILAKAKKFASEVKGIYGDVLLEDPEQVLFEASVQKNTGGNNADKFFGKNILKLAKELYPTATLGDKFSRKISQAIDENGEPVVVYHGTSTRNTMDNFQFVRGKWTFTSDYEAAKEKASKFFGNTDETSAVVYPLFLRLRSSEDGSVSGQEYIIKDQTSIKSVDNTGRFTETPAVFDMPSVSNTANFNKYNKFINERRVRIGRIITTINTERNKRPQDKLKIERLQARIEDIRKELEQYEKKITLDRIHEAGLKDIQEVVQSIGKGMSADELESAYHIVTLWSNANDILFDTDELVRDSNGKQSENVRMFSSIIADAVGLRTELDAIQRELVAKQTSSVLNVSMEIAREGIKQDFRDVSSLTSWFRDISNYNNLPLSGLDLIVRKASYASNQEFIDFGKKLNSVMKDIKDKNFDLLLQEDERGVKTGLFVTRFSHKYQKTRSKMRSKAEETGNYTEYINWLRDETEHFDVNKLFYIDEYDDVILKDNVSHTAELVKQLGQDLYAEYLDKQKASIELYIERKYSYQASLDADEDLDVAEKKLRLDEWDIANSPFIWCSHLSSPDGAKYLDSNKKFIKLKGYKYNQSFPKKFKGNEKTEWWDDKFEKLEANKPLLELQKLSIKVINNLFDYLPDNVVEQLEYNTIPILEKTLLDLFKGKEGAAALVGLQDSMIKAVTAAAESDVVYGDINPITGKPEQSLKVGMLNYEQRINKIYKFKLENFMLDNDLAEDEVKPEDAIRLKQEATDEFNNDRSYDIPKVLSAFAAMALNFKHKSKVEGAVKLVQSFIHNSLESYETQDGRIKKDKFGENILSKGSLTNLKNALDYYVDVFYNDKPDDKTLKNKKLYSSKEKELNKKYDEKIEKLKKQLESKEIEEADFKFQNTLIESKKAELGRNVSLQNVGRTLLRYNQLKGMGWNAFAGITNLVYGWISNATHAAGEEDFTFKHLRKAKYYSIILSKEPKTRNKIWNLMRKFDVLKESSEAHSKDRIADSKKYLGWNNLKPFEIQKSSDYTVQSELLLALMFATPITDLAGVERNVYEAYNELGEWKVEEFGDNPEWSGDINSSEENSGAMALKFKTDQLVKKLHANVDPLSPIYAKKTILGKMLMQFRSWVPEGFANRFEKEKNDYLLGRVKKGRYRSFVELKDSEGAKIESPLYTAISATIGSMMNLVSLGTVAKGAGKNLSKVDRANLRKNAYELITYIALYCTVAGLKTIVDDDDEDKKMSINYMINQGFRLQGDILFYTSPIAFERIADNALPIFGLVTDTYKWFDSMGGLIMGNDIYTTGIYAGDSKFGRATAKMVPFATQVVRNIGAAERVINK